MSTVSTTAGAGTNTISGSIKWTGLASGTDFDSVVDSLIQIERRTITRQETWKSQWEEKQTAINNLDTRLSALKTGAGDYKTRDQLLSRKATSADEKVVTITNTSTAATGSYSVEVAEKVADIKASRSFKANTPIGVTFNADGDGAPVDENGDVVAVRALNEESLLAMVALKLPASTKGPLSFDYKSGEFKDGDGQVVAQYDASDRTVNDAGGSLLFRANDGDWLVETAQMSVACALGDPAMWVTYNGATGEFKDNATQQVVAKLDTRTSVVSDMSGQELFKLDASGVNENWEYDSAAAFVSRQLAGGAKVTFDQESGEFRDAAGNAVARLNKQSHEIFAVGDDGETAPLMTLSGHGLTEWDDPNVIKFLEDSADISDTLERPFTKKGNAFYSGDTLVAELDTKAGEIKLPDSSAKALLKVGDDGRLMDPSTKKALASSDESRYRFGPMTFTMGGKTLSLKFDPSYDPAKDGVKTGVFSSQCTMEDLCDIINATAKEMGADGPAIKAEIQFDKTRAETFTNDEGEEETREATYNRLRIVGGEAGAANAITIFDPTGLCMDEASVDEPQTTQWIGSTAQPQLGAESQYLGHSNKTITFVVSEGGTLGADEIKISWADTEGKAGSFVIKPEDWDEENKRLKEDVAVTQGVTVNFGGAGGDSLMKNNAFSIDCQNPSVQKATDSGLAQADKWVHKGFPDLTSPVVSGAGHLDFTYAGMEYSIPVKDGTTLSGLAETINSSGKNPGVIASVLNDGMGTATSYKLVLTGASSGAEHEIRILSSSSLNHLDCSPAAFSHARVATNSMCRVDGYPNDGVSWIQRQTNEVSDVIDGTVLQLEGTGETKVNIVNDISSMADKIKQIVEAANYALSYISEQTAYRGGEMTITVKANGSTQRGSSGKASGVMNGNYGFQIANSDIKNIMSSPIFTRDEYIKAIDPEGEKEAKLTRDEQQKLYDDYLDQNGLIYAKLSDIGIEYDAKATTDYSESETGAYVVNSSKLNEALRKNPEAVIKLFTFRPDDSFPTTTKYEDEDPRPNLYGGVCQKLYYSMGDLTRTSDVYDKQTGEIVQSAKGIMRVLSENYSNIISGIDDKIASEEKRIALKKTRMQESYARLETTLATLQNQSTQLESQLKSLDKSGS